MGQLVARFTGGIEKTDVNVDNQTYAVEGDMDGGGDRPSTRRITRPKVQGSF